MARPEYSRLATVTVTRRPTLSRARIRILLAAALVLTNFLALAGPIKAQANMVTGTLIFKDKVGLSPAATAVITLTDRSKDGAGTIIGQQRLDAVTGTQIAFAVQFDPAIINQKHAYSVYASLIDGDQQWQNADPVPTITGGPLDGLEVPLSTAQYETAAQISGTIVAPSGTEFSDTAVAYAGILNATTGRLVSRQVILAPLTSPIPFVVGYDAALINPDDTYVAAAGVIDGATLWQSQTPTPITPDGVYELDVVQTSTVIPVPGASPSAEPSESAVPSESTEPSPSVEPSQSTEPSVTPTDSGSPQPTTSAKPTKTPKPTATPTE